MSATARVVRDLTEARDAAGRAPVSARCPDKIPYMSERCADNAVWLHQAAFPDCHGISSYACGDHWHIGHQDKTVRDACRRVASARPRYRPRHGKRRPT